MDAAVRRSNMIFLFLAAAVLLAGLAVFFGYDSIPGSLRRVQTSTGDVYRGTGAETSRYKAGPTKLIEDVRRGTVYRSRWFKPDGTMIAETLWTNKGGVGYYIREDGSVKSKMTYVNGLADGPAWYFNPDGSPAGEARFENGSYVSGFRPPPSF